MTYCCNKRRSNNFFFFSNTNFLIRYVFSAIDLEVCAPCYEYFKELLTDNNDWCRVELLDCNFSQHFQYNKVKELVIFKLTANE